MLVLTRKVGEAIVIGSNVVVKVVDVRGDQVRIGIDAPRQVPVHREEVYREVVRTNTAAAAAAQRTAHAIRQRRGGTPPR